MNKLVLTIVILAVTPAAWPDVAAVVTGDVDEVTSLDEVLIQGDRTLSAARKAMIEAEDRFYARWNALNKDPMYAISCRRQMVRVNFSARVCEPGFLADSAAADAARMHIVVDDKLITAADAPVVMLRAAELKKRTLAMIEKDPALKRALLERARLQQHYVELRKEKFKDHWIVWN
jgi:hypothetical protein